MIFGGLYAKILWLGLVFMFLIISFNHSFDITWLTLAEELIVDSA